MSAFSFGGHPPFSHPLSVSTHPGRSRDRCQFAFKRHNSPAELIVIDLHENTCCLVGQFRQHGTFFVAERIAGRVRPIECQPKATQPVSHRDCENRSRQTIRKFVSRSSRSVDIIRRGLCSSEQGSLGSSIRVAPSQVSSAAVRRKTWPCSRKTLAEASPRALCTPWTSCASISP